MTKLGVVVIGRNEGERLICCLRSVEGAGEMVYVDSGSTDGSPAAAEALGARVVPLDMTRPFTAARARNAGVAALSADCALVQFVDGDCALQPGWIPAARLALEEDSGLAAAFGRRREIHPEASRYNWLCDQEWAVPAGEVGFFGGDVLLRRQALDAAGGYPDEMIAGEEPDLSIRMRTLGWRIRCLPEEMTLHDAAITRFGQWWRRALRSGHAYAELADRNRASPLHDYRRRMRGAFFWGAILPGIGLLLLLAGMIARNWPVTAVAGLVFLLPLAQLLRLWLREARGRPFGEAGRMALFLMLAKPAQSIGIWRYWRGKLGGRRSALIEYKGAGGSTDRIGLWAQIKEDWQYHGRDWTRPGFRTLAVHRFGTWRADIRPKLLRVALTYIYLLLFRHCRNVYGIELPASAQVGRRVVIEHQGGIVVHGASVIGNDCILRQCCTLGLRWLDDLSAAPVLEDGVQLGAGAVVLGRIRIGKGAVIGANAVVLQDVPPGGRAVGIPARVTMPSA